MIDDLGAQHTPGPWTVVDNSWETSTVYSHDGHGVIAECPIDSSVDELTQDHLEAVKEANARLIAVAPELLEALQVMVADFGDYPASERPCRAFDLARAAIAKACDPQPQSRTAP